MKASRNGVEARDAQKAAEKAAERARAAEKVSDLANADLRAAKKESTLPGSKKGALGALELRAKHVELMSEAAAKASQELSQKAGRASVLAVPLRSSFIYVIFRGSHAGLCSRQVEVSLAVLEGCVARFEEVEVALESACVLRKHSVELMAKNKALSLNLAKIEVDITQATATSVASK